MPKRSSLLLPVVVATALAVWLRTYGITSQVVIDDEWHAIHKLMSSSYADIFMTFGVADHSIPLTLLYKAMADTVGLAEGRLRALQIACGIALVPAAAWLAWRATRDAPAAALFGFLVSASPFLVMWSRFARPYAISLLAAILCMAAVWAWQTHRTAKWMWLAALAALLTAWFHPFMGIYPALACAFVYFRDLLVAPGRGPRPSWSSMRLGVVVAAAMALPLAPALVNDHASLSGKAGGDQADWSTLERMFAIVWGGVPTGAMWLACAAAACGLVVLWRRDRALAAYLLVLGTLPGALLALLGAHWLHAGQVFLRYTLPLLPLMLFLGSVGAIALARGLWRRREEAVAWGAAAALCAAYLVATPAVLQAATLGTWYAHIDYHWDYRYRWMVAKKRDRAFDPPEFYRRLGALPPGSAPIIEAPFNHAAPFNPLAYYATYHRQPETFGMVHDLCLDGERFGEVPRDRRFRFRKFVFLDDVAAVRRTGAAFLVLHRERIFRRPFHENGRCIQKLSMLYGPPTELDERVAVFDLVRGVPSGKLK